MNWTLVDERFHMHGRPTSYTANDEIRRGIEDIPEIIPIDGVI